MSEGTGEQFESRDIEATEGLGQTIYRVRCPKCQNIVMVLFGPTGWDTSCNCGAWHMEVKAVCVKN